jgi:hypothetical protein
MSTLAGRGVEPFERGLADGLPLGLRRRREERAGVGTRSVFFSQGTIVKRRVW